LPKKSSNGKTDEVRNGDLEVFSSQYPQNQLNDPPVKKNK